ncbi:kinase-like protein [Rickenella mellea]|uniref:Kinase-like protein n=1 Tax=Rickenella mellea TaxID=50990 RepID=A0A4Y7QK24_9AGAM|nr:kinase-like protein [Rickenella mellea]
MLAAATSFFSRTAISQSYNIGSSGSGSGSRSSTPGPSRTPSTQLPVTSHTPSFHVGLWRVQSATHKVTNKRVSVWLFEKKVLDGDKSMASGRDRVIDALKAEASALGRLRHPSILEMVEPLEETRSELIFATEPLLSSLYLSIPSPTLSTPLVELDEVEIQKGILQLCKGLTFLHTSGRLIHSNINPETILINSSGDWKLSGLGLTIPLSGPDGKPTRWTSPMHDRYMPTYVQRSFDFMAPEYALDERLVTASDMYSLGCLIYAAHSKGNPPFKNHNNLSSLRDNAGRALPNMERFDPDLRGLLTSMVTRHSHERPTPEALPTYPFFSSLPISTLNFLDRSTFASKSREEKITFMKGLTGVLERFSEGLRTRKILPSLLEEMKDTHLLPYILPNVFAISTSLSSGQFASLVLPSLKPLFAVKDPPQNMLTLLENIALIQSKTDKGVFREHVLPLVYNALESEHAVVQERALKVVPDLCETIDYAEVQGVLFPRVAVVFTGTRILSVKVTTLQTFLAMVKTLDQTSLTQKLVPLLSKIRTKEPAVMLATLAVQEAMGLKVDREAVATLVLPQLWTMSMGPLLNIDQFQRFMSVIRKLGERVEREHNQHLRDSQRIEDRSGTNGIVSVPNAGLSGSLDFESLVAGAQNTAVKPDSILENGKGWDDDVWGSIFNSASEPPAIQSPTLQPQHGTQSLTQSLPSSPRMQPNTSSNSVLSRPMGSAVATPKIAPPTSFYPSTMITTPSQTSNWTHPHASQSTAISAQQSLQASVIPPPGFSSQHPFQPQRPNYNINFTPSLPLTSTPAQVTPAPSMSLLSPSVPVQQWGAASNKKPTKDDLRDFDPLG